MQEIEFTFNGFYKNPFCGNSISCTFLREHFFLQLLILPNRNILKWGLVYYWLIVNEKAALKICFTHLKYTNWPLLFKLIGYIIDFCECVLWADAQFIKDLLQKERYNNISQYFDKQLGIQIVIGFMHIVTNGKTSNVVRIQCIKNLYSAPCVRVY